jgi:Mycobacterial cell wall arabinan synthesis protein
VRRSRLALGLALAALAAAVFGALGPADDVRTTYSWPPAELPDVRPRVWHTPLMLLQRQPESISARIPCVRPESAGPTTILATTPPETNGGLAVTSNGGTLAVALGGQILTQVPASDDDDAASSCAHRLELREGEWLLESSARRASGILVAMPVVEGIFSELDLTSGAPPTIEITTAAHDVRPTALQKLAWIFSAVALVAALGLVSFDRRPSWRPARPRFHLADAVVGLALLAWWIFSPAYWDDGWIAARLASYDASGGFSTYYDVLGSNNPLGFWLDWVQRLFLLASDSLLVLRIPALLALAGTWVLCRWILARSAVPGLAVWSLAAVFLLGAFAWGMTLRPEFALALLVTATVACTVRFLERGTVGPLALVAVLVPLAVLAHPAGFVAAAPLLLAAPRLFRWVRGQWIAAATLVVAGAALLVLLGFVGSDVGQRRDDARAFETYGTSTQSWRDESMRYTRMSEFPFATPVRRTWVALAALAVLAFLLRRRRADTQLLNLPAATLGLGLVLLVATPSKWPWHFGALIGVAALAAASETARLRSEAERESTWDFRPFAIGGAVMLAALWSWSPRTPWALVDLRVLDWILGFESRFSLSKAAFALPLALVLGLGIAEVVRGRGRLHEVPWRVATWSALVLTVPALVFTATVLVVDNAKADAWTLARQNLGTLRGDSDCGLAEELTVAGEPLARRLESKSTPTYVVPDLVVYFPCIRQPLIRGGVAEVPRYVVSPFDGSGLENWDASPFHPIVDLYTLERLPLAGEDVFVFEVGSEPPGWALAEPDVGLPSDQAR